MVDQLPLRRDLPLPEDASTPSAMGKPLAIILSPMGDHLATAGATLEISLAVFNRGGRNAIIHIYLSDTSETVTQWCTSPFERLAIGPGQSSDVLFRLQVPAQTLPGTYNYQVIVDAPQHYPEDTPIQYNQRLQVLPQVATVVQVSDPTFTLQPITTSQQPAVLQPGSSLDVRVQVYNRSNRVDRFHLSCPTLDSRWFKVTYPQNLATPGLITGGSGLELNPGDRGEILLRLAPPPDALAGSYTPTLRLHSTNQPDLVLMDLFHLEVSPLYQMRAELQTLISKIRHNFGVYRIQLINQGNTPRELLLGAHSAEEEEVRLCRYRWVNQQNQKQEWTIVPPATTPDRPAAVLSPSLPVLPGQTLTLDLEIQPAKPSQRPWLGNGRIFNFVVDLEDCQQRPLTIQQLQGRLLWRPRPFWQFLLLLLAALGTIGAIAFLIWWWFFRPPAPSEILEITAGDLAYEEVRGEPIRLNWQISNPKRIQSLRLVGLSSETGAILSQPVTYDFSQGLPRQLKPFCSLNQVLTCQRVPTDAFKAGSYTFELQIFPRRATAQPLDSERTKPIKISPLPLPKILELGSTEPSYQEPVRSTNPDDGRILLNWKVAHPKLLQEVQLIGRAPDGSVVVPLQKFDFSEGVPSPLKPYCELQTALVCQKVPTSGRQPGDYLFELLVVSRTAPEEPVAARKTDIIRITPKQIPLKIVQFLINGEPAPPKLLIQLEPNQPAPKLEIAWKVEGGRGLKVELLPAPGSVGPSGSIAYQLGSQSRQDIIVLQVTDATGAKVSRSIAIETSLPPADATQSTPALPMPALPGMPGAFPADSGLTAPAAQSGGASPGSAPAAPAVPATSPPLVPGRDLKAPAPVRPGSVSPADLPPQFDR